jgi:hypothetical protein
MGVVENRYDRIWVSQIAACSTVGWMESGYGFVESQYNDKNVGVKCDMNLLIRI